jgi:magnesium transporter
MPVNLLIYDREKGLSVYDDLSGLSTRNDNSIIWLDIQTNESALFSEIASQFGIHELSIEDCFTPGHPPKFEDFGEYIFMILRSLKSISVLEDIVQQSERIGSDRPIETGEHESPPAHERFTRKLSIFISERCLITFRRNEIQWLDAIVRQVKLNPERILGGGTDVLAHRVMDVLFDRFARSLGYFEKVIEGYEDRAIQNPDDFELDKLLDLKRELLSLKQISRDHRGVIVRLMNESGAIIKKNRRRYFRDIEDHAASIINMLDKQVDTLLGVRDSYLALANARLSDTMRVLTVITTVAAPLNILVGLYGMNFQVLPGAHNPYGFWMMLVLIIVVTLFMLRLFLKRRWL